MNQKKITVIGSSNTDMVIKTSKLPVPGETIMGGNFFMNPGGKGANQAVAATRLGGKVVFVTKTGNDIFGKQSLKLFEDEGIDIRFAVSDPQNPSGVALITVDANGENCIVVAPGSNGTLNKKDIDLAKEEICTSGFVLMQLEIPIEGVQYVAEMAHKVGAKVILNPAPARQLPDALLKYLYLITPNETETEIITGVKVHDIASAQEASRILLKKGVQNVIITMGSKGAFLFNEQESKMIPTVKVTPVDTTAAGDVFNGALAVALAEGKSFSEAIEFANKAGAISVTRMGAQSSAPYRKEIK